MKLTFRYSNIYDLRYRESKKIQKYLKEQNKTYPSRKKVKDYIQKIEKEWGKQEEKVLNKISKTSGLKWKQKEIICYVIGYGRPFSDPLTMRIYPNINDFIDNLTHELIHNIQLQNGKNISKWWKYVEKNYKNESRLTKNHLFLHAVHWEILKSLFGIKRLNRNLKNTVSLDYKRSWEIIEKMGAKNLIKEFNEMIK